MKNTKTNTTNTTTIKYDKCFICGNKGFYTDKQGVWHNCPKCNPLINNTIYTYTPKNTVEVTYDWTLMGKQ